MIANSLLGALALAGTALAFPIENPISVMKRAPEAGIVITKCAKPGVIALAYDDGPYTYTSELIDILDEGGAKATFFWTGTLYGCIYGQAEAVKKAYASGHQIASHTWTHPQSFGNMNAQQLTSEMQQVEEALANLVLPTMRQLGYKVITDDVDSQDWNGWSAQQSQNAFSQAGSAETAISPHARDLRQHRPATHPWLINWAKQNNLEMVTVAECLDDPDGMYQPGNFTSTGKNSC
ncbi:unnamed protein product [Parascedosporium putredinis]|uniref:NodB homology domain-containing protein n=1 Tax=Parascedosporium putredinis TaxID=1442378 RepID=A0A9P1H0R8_9PEZI|nr:unnamed protein product [Parascedosporium putredinis]CAI7992113.1 unnamed protein product [Parascedosporium putredinis]